MVKWAVGGLILGVLIGLIIIYFDKKNQNRKSKESGECFRQCYNVEKKSFDECSNKCKQLLK